MMMPPSPLKLSMPLVNSPESQAQPLTMLYVGKYKDKVEMGQEILLFMFYGVCSFHTKGAPGLESWTGVGGVVWP